MRKLSFLLLILTLSLQSVWAFSEQFKIFESDKKTKSCRTSVVNITNEREPLFCTYVLSPNVGGAKVGTLLFEFILNPNNPKSVEIKDRLVAVLRDLKGQDDSRVVISLVLTNNERLYFDASDFSDWQKDEWRQLLRVSYDKETTEWRSQVMFPLEHMWSSERDLPASTRKRYQYVIERLQSYSIKQLCVSDVYGRVHIELEVPFERPTDGTITNMIKRCKRK